MLHQVDPDLDGAELEEGGADEEGAELEEGGADESERAVLEIVALIAALKATKKREKQTRVETNTRKVREQADRVLDRTQLQPALQAYDASTTTLARNLHREFLGRGQAKIDIASTSQILRTAGDHLQGFGADFGRALRSSTRDVLAEGYHATASFLSSMFNGATPLNDHTTAQRVVHAQAQKIAPLREASARAISQDITEILREKLQLLPLDVDATIADMLSETDQILEIEAWRIERIVRTETVYAFNAAQAAAVSKLSKIPEFRGLMNRWTELVDDLTRAPLDRRVGKDSIVLHGQVAKPDDVFTMPPNADVPRHLAGGSWSHPPNRPNDRAILIPWMPDWGVPAWVYRLGASIPL
jgi:hypothetical protein